MATLSLKGFLTSVLPIEEVGDNKTKIQKVYIMVPGYVNQFQEKIGNDEIWELKVIGENVNKLNLAVGDFDKKKVAVNCFINSRMFYKKEDISKKEPIFNIEAVLSTIEFL